MLTSRDRDKNLKGQIGRRKVRGCEARTMIGPIMGSNMTQKLLKLVSQLVQVPGTHVTCKSTMSPKDAWKRASSCRRPQQSTFV